MEKPIKITNAKIKKIIISFMGNFIKQTIVIIKKIKEKNLILILIIFADDCLTAKKFILNEIILIFFFKNF